MINWGIIGFGRMGKQYADCFKKKNLNAELVAIASKSYQKSKDKDNDIKYFNSYSDLIKCDLVDAIYISTLNNTHKDLVLEGEKYNKKILCEKPLGINFKEVKELYDLFKDKKTFFNEAIAYRSHPQTSVLLNILKEKEFGRIKKIESNFGFRVRKIKKDSRLFNKKVGGGSILDLGCYPVSFFHLFKGEKKIKIIKSNRNLCETSVDIDGEIHLKLNDEIDSIGKVSLRKSLENNCKIYCENAIITLPQPWLPSNKSFIEVETKSRYYKKIIETNKNVYEHQIEASSIFFSNNNTKSNLLIDIDQSLEISKIIDIWKNNRD